ncbi:MAG TPA: MFS transporter [Jiangellaceae bacterium]|nr:MFS transporter [Jiangellaceae bacterium]
MPRALLALALGAFGIGTTEFVVMGLLPQIASGFGVSVPAVGMVISAYAIGVVVGAPTLTALSVRMSARQTLVALMWVFVLGNTLSAMAPTYELLVAARVITALTHGAFFGVGAMAARRSVPANRATQAISLMFMGLTLANVFGVPLGTLVGQQLGWRWVFVGIAAVGVVTVVLLQRWLPVEDGTRMALGQELGAFRRGQVWLVLGITTVGFGATFAVYSYVSPILTDLAGVGASAVTWVLALFGVGMTIGTMIGGRFGDQLGLRALVWGMAAMSAVLVVFTVTAHHPVTAVVTLVVFGIVGFSMGPIVQNRVIVAAGAGGSVVSAANQGAFNMANALGASVGALVLDLGFGLTAPMWVGAVLALGGLALVLVTRKVERRDVGAVSVRQDDSAVMT